jgi:hypothetical protein
MGDFPCAVLNVPIFFLLFRTGRCHLTPEICFLIIIQDQIHAPGRK